MTRFQRGDALIGAQGIVMLVLTAAVLYFARDVFIPIALAVVLTFLLAPGARRLEQFGIGRLPSVLLMVGASAALVAGLGWIVFQQMMPLGEQFPTYVATIQKKLSVLKLSEAGSLTRLRDAIVNLGNGFVVVEPASSPTSDASVLSPNGPLPVRVVEQPTHPLVYARSFVEVAFGRVATIVIVIVFSIFMLLEREDLRGRVIHLLGVGSLHRTTSAFDEAAQRVSRFLIMQLATNATCGLLIGLGLWWIGVPSPALWGMLLALLRFVPYIGAWIAGALPVLAAFGGVDDPSAPLLVLALVIVVEVGMSHIVEPLIFATGTGLSTVALVCATVFWAWLWGPAGLLLATPLTVCMVVLGRHIPGLEVFDVMLGSRPALEPHVQFYQRLLAGDDDGASRIIEQNHKELCAMGPHAVYDTLIIPAIRLAEIDRARGELFGDRAIEFDQLIAAIVDDLTSRVTNPSEGPMSESCDQNHGRIVIIPARTLGDELAARLLTDLLTTAGKPTELVAASALTGESVSRLEADPPAAVCISATPPGSVLHARVLAKRLRAALPNLPIIIGLWDESADAQETRLRFGTSATDHVLTRAVDVTERAVTLSGSSAAVRSSPPAVAKSDLDERALIGA